MLNPRGLMDKSTDIETEAAYEYGVKPCCRIFICFVDLSILFNLCQNLDACSSFQQKIAKVTPFPLESKHCKLTLHTVRIHGVSRHLYKELD